MAEQRNRPIDDAGLIAAYRNPECHPKDVFGDSILGLHNGATVKLEKRNGYTVVAYSPGTRAVFEHPSKYRSEWIKEQTCESVHGVSMTFGPTRLCAPAVIAPTLAAVDARLGKP